MIVKLFDVCAFIAFVYVSLLTVSQLDFTYVDVRNLLGGCCPFSHFLYFVFPSRFVFVLFALAGVSGVYLLLPSRAAILVLFFPMFQLCTVLNLTEPLFVAVVFLYLQNSRTRTGLFTKKGVVAWLLAVSVRINALPLILARSPIGAALALLPAYLLMWNEVDLFVWLRYLTPSILVLFARASQTKLFYPLLAWELFMMPGVWENIHNGLEVMS